MKVLVTGPKDITAAETVVTIVSTLANLHLSKRITELIVNGDHEGCTELVRDWGKRSKIAIREFRSLEGDGKNAPYFRDKRMAQACDMAVLFATEGKGKATRFMRNLCKKNGVKVMEVKAA